MRWDLWRERPAKRKRIGQGKRRERYDCEMRPVKGETCKTKENWQRKMKGEIWLRDEMSDRRYLRREGEPKKKIERRQKTVRWDLQRERPANGKTTGEGNQKKTKDCEMRCVIGDTCEWKEKWKMKMKRVTRLWDETCKGRDLRMERQLENDNERGEKIVRWDV